MEQSCNLFGRLEHRVVKPGYQNSLVAIWLPGGGSQMFDNK